MNQEVILITREMFIKRPPGSEETSAELKRPERAGQLVERVRRLPLVRGHSGQERIKGTCDLFHSLAWELAT